MALVSDQLRLLVEEFPHEVAYRVVDRGELTFADWDGGASRFARGLIDAGVLPQDRVALALSPEDALVNLVAYMGVHKAGGACVPVNVRLSPRELLGVLTAAAPRVVVVSAGLLERFAGVLDVVEGPPQLVVVGDGDGDGTDGATGARLVGWHDFLADDPSDLQVDLDGDAIADILFTSGTTGRPKGVVARHDRATTVEIGRPHDFTGGLWFHASPLFTFAGVSFITVPARLGMTGLYLPRFDAQRWLQVAESDPVVMAFLVPSMAELLLADPTLPGRDLSSLMMVSVGSAPVHAETLQALHRRLPNATVANSYSMTEAGQAYCVMPPESFGEREGSVGRPVPPLEVRIVDEGGEQLPAGEVGEIRLRNPGKQREYLDDPEATAATWDEQGWLATGDLGRVDDEGFLYIVGRLKDVIIRGGNNVHARDVEEVLRSHPAVREAAVIGVPHDVLGEDVAAVVVPADLDVDELRTWCEERLADYKRPRRIEPVDELPRNAMGKVVKPELVARLAAAAP